MRTQNVLCISTHSQTILLVIEHDHSKPSIVRIEMSVFGQKLSQQREASPHRGSGRLAVLQYRWGNIFTIHPNNSIQVTARNPLSFVALDVTRIFFEICVQQIGVDCKRDRYKMYKIEKLTFIDLATFPRWPI